VVLGGLLPRERMQEFKKQEVWNPLTFFFASRTALDPLKGDLNEPETLRLRRLFTVRKDEPAVVE